VSESNTPAKGNKAPIIITIIMMAVVGAFFVIAFAASSAQSAQDLSVTPIAEAYMDIVTPLLANADPVRGEKLVKETYECYACHIAGSGNLAPAFEGLGAIAAERRAPMKAEAYLYEAIVYPTVHVVEGYAASMPANYETRISDEEMGDILAYLLGQ